MSDDVPVVRRAKGEEVRQIVNYPIRSGLMTTPRSAIASPDEINARINAALAALPDDRRGAVVAYGDTLGRARLAVAGRSGEHWSYVGTLTHEPGQWSGEVAVRYSW